MRKINFLLVSLLVVASGFFASCSKDDDELDNGPAISFSNNETSTTLASGVTQYEINGKITSVAGLKEVRFYQVTSAGEEQIGSTVTDFSNKNDYDFKFSASNVFEETVIKVEAEDKNTKKASKNFTIKVTATNPPATDKLISYTGTMAAQLGAQSSTSLGSAYATSTGSVYLKAAAKTNASKVDFIYFYSSTASVGAEMISPKYAETNYTDYVTGWTTKNDTKFKMSSVTAAQFDAIANTDESLVVAETGVTEQRVTSLAVDKVFAFVTAGGKKGLAKVKALSASASGSITIEVKVQK